MKCFLVSKCLFLLKVWASLCIVHFGLFQSHFGIHCLFNLCPPVLQRCVTLCNIQYSSNTLTPLHQELFCNAPVVQSCNLHVLDKCYVVGIFEVWRSLNFTFSACKFMTEKKMYINLISDILHTSRWPNNRLIGQNRRMAERSIFEVRCYLWFDIRFWWSFRGCCPKRDKSCRQRLLLLLLS